MKIKQQRPQGEFTRAICTHTEGKIGKRETHRF